jgi:hypothetical protein
MKGYTPFILIIALFVTSCGTVVNSPLESSVPSNTTETTTISELIVPTTTNLKLEDFTNREFVGEDNNYSVYLINSNNDNENVKTGEIIVYIKSSNQIMQINGSFTVIMEGTMVYDDGTGEYIFLSIGSSPVRRAIVISLKDRKQAIQELCITSGYTEGLIFWKKNIVINTCDTNRNRPWESNIASSIEFINLENRKITNIAKSDDKKQYQIKAVEGNYLIYIEEFVFAEEDWVNVDMHQVEEKSIDLSIIAGE